MAAAAMGDSGNFADFVERHRAGLVQSARRIAVDAAEAEDVVQDTLLALWPRWHDHPPTDQAAYAFRAVTLNAIKRRMRRRKWTTLDAAAGIPAPPPIDPVELESIIARLPAAQQVVIRMRFYLGLSLVQIGRSLSISSNTAASRCRYALAEMRKTLDGRRRKTGAAKESNHGTESTITR